jgi:hypothetical protein
MGLSDGSSLGAALGATLGRLDSNTLHSEPCCRGRHRRWLQVWFGRPQMRHASLRWGSQSALKDLKARRSGPCHWEQHLGRHRWA